ncbi:MAG: hypothetical protein ABIF77_08240 [bacterium]
MMLVNPPAGLDKYLNLRTSDLQTPSEDVIYWSIDPDEGLVQGPLDLGFMRGKLLHLALSRHQLALHVRSGELQAVFLEGTHAMRVGPARGQLPQDSELLFLQMDLPFAFLWSGTESVWIPTRDDQPQELRIDGECNCLITGPERFYATFLRNAETQGEPFMRRLIDTLIRSQCAQRLGNELHGRPLTTEAVSAAAAKLIPEDLSPELAKYGLSCSQLALQVIPLVTGKVTHSTGQSAVGHVNSGQ